MEVMQHFARLQLDKEPFIRTNTTICLGRIAKHLAPAVFLLSEIISLVNNAP